MSFRNSYYPKPEGTFSFLTPARHLTTRGSRSEVLRRRGDQRSLDQLLRLVTVSTAVGNLDLHAKNVSWLHDPNGSSTLAPAYDLVPMRHHQNDGRMAMSIDGVYLHAQLTREHLLGETTSWGLRNPAPIVNGTLEMIAERVEYETPHAKAHASLARDIRRFTHNLLADVGELRSYQQRDR